jgi:hypothetical protein
LGFQTIHHFIITKNTAAGNISTETAGLTTVKPLFNSILSTPNAKIMTMDIKDFYPNNPMHCYKNTMIPVSLIPKAIHSQLNLASLVHNGYVYVRIHEGMYSLPQEGKIKNECPCPLCLALHGYHQCAHTPGPFKHLTHPVMFSLFVDDFGVRNVGRENAQHLADAAKYKITTDWT